jgi:hypothetical protein
MQESFCGGSSCPQKIRADFYDGDKSHKQVVDVPWISDCLSMCECTNIGHKGESSDGVHEGGS